MVGHQQSFSTQLIVFRVVVMPDTLESIMKELRLRINTDDTMTQVSPEEIEELKAETIVVMPAGGK